jgi:Tfp pilus assembly protein PilV
MALLHATRSTGFGFVEVLIALLLLALALLGAGVTLVQSMHANHAASLQTRAVDLATDLAEDLQSARSATNIAAAIARWRQLVPATLPVGGIAPAEYSVASLVTAGTGPAPTRFDLQLRWLDGATNEPFTLLLPVVAPLPEAAL